MNEDLQEYERVEVRYFRRAGPSAPDPADLLIGVGVQGQTLEDEDMPTSRTFTYGDGPFTMVIVPVRHGRPVRADAAVAVSFDGPTLDYEVLPAQQDDPAIRVRFDVPEQGDERTFAGLVTVDVDPGSGVTSREIPFSFLVVPGFADDFRVELSDQGPPAPAPEPAPEPNP